MKCENCPLMFVERTSWDVPEYELMCAATMLPTVYSINDIDDTGCHRTDKWILSQDKEKLIAAYEAKEIEALNEYIKEKGWDFQ
jgi:hypothetical protein